MKTEHSSIIKSIATELGFSFCGISKAGFLEEEAPKLEAWLKRGYHGKMQYMENHFDKRLDPTKLMPGAKSVVSLVYNYFPENDLNEPLKTRPSLRGDEAICTTDEFPLNEGRGSDAPTSKLKIAKYAYGEDYHIVIKEKLKTFLERIQQKIGDIHGRVFVDSAPVMERQWAAKSGIGWIGKNSLLLNKQMGSFFFLAELILDLELEPDGPMKDYCGTCTACIDACPTDAIHEAYIVDASKCISYLTIELKEAIPSEFKGKMDNWIFGCDICQDVCPWNRFSKPHADEKFNPSGEWPQFDKNDWKELTEEIFEKNFSKSAMLRTGFLGMRRNVGFLGE